MKVTSQNKRFLHQDLETALLGFYSADALRAICLELIFPYLGKAPPAVKLVKGELVKVVYSVLSDPVALLPFFQSLDGSLQKVLSYLAWEGDCLVKTLEAELGIILVSRKKKPSHWVAYRAFEESELLKGFHFVALEEKGGPYHLGSRDDVLTVSLPEAIRKLLCKTLPEKPSGWEIEPTEESGLRAEHRYCCEGEAIVHLSRASDFIDKKHLKTTQTGKPNKATLRQLNSLMGNREFFPPSKEEPRLEHVRTQLLVALVRALPGTLRSELAHARVKPVHLRQIVRFLEENPCWVFDSILTHLFFDGRSIRVDKEAWSRFHRFIRSLPQGQWVTWDTLRRHHRYRGLDFCFCYDSGVATRLDYDSRSRPYYYGNSLPLRPENSVHMVDHPLLCGYAFLLATLGFAEIAFNTPPAFVGDWTPKGTLWLTPFDGLQAIRFTREGLYALGLVDEVELKVVEDPRSRITLNPNCLNAICQDIDPVTELSMLQFMEKISPGHYRLTRSSFLEGCRNKADAGNRLLALRDVVGENLPPLWEEFLKTTVTSSVALKQVKGYRLYQLEKDKELVELFATDPVLRSTCVKAEGLRVLIQDKDMPTVQRHLKHLGYILQ